MKKHRIMLMFDHPGCPEDVVIDIHLPLAEEESLDTVAARIQPTCPICKTPMRFAGWSPDHTFYDDKEPDTTAPQAQGHAPKITLDRARIVGCTCGWRTPPGTTDSDDAFSEHVAINTKAGGRQ